MTTLKTYLCVDKRQSDMPIGENFSQACSEGCNGFDKGCIGRRVGNSVLSHCSFQNANTPFDRQPPVGLSMLFNSIRTFQANLDCLSAIGGIIMEDEHG